MCKVVFGVWVGGRVCARATALRQQQDLIGGSPAGVMLSKKRSREADAPDVAAEKDKLEDWEVSDNPCVSACCWHR